MNCKNCNHTIHENDNFCPNCSARIVKERITFKNLVIDVFFKAIGWDSKYFTTFRKMISNPQEVCEAYIDGVRKRYVNPITFFIIGMTISLIAFNLFQDDYISLSTTGDVNHSVTDSTGTVVTELSTQEIMAGTGMKELDPETIERMQQQAMVMANIQRLTLKYFNVYSFVLLPIYGLMSFLVFWRRHNYGEQLVINGYIQGSTFTFSAVFFILGIYVYPPLYLYSTVLTILFYTYVYARIYRLSFLKSVLYLLKFLGILILFVIALSILTFLVLLGLHSIGLYD